MDPRALAEIARALGTTEQQALADHTTARQRLAAAGGL